MGGSAGDDIMSDIGLYGICAAMIGGVVIVVLVLRKWTKHNKFGISEFGLLLGGLVFLTIGVWGSLEITVGNIKVFTRRDSAPIHTPMESENRVTPSPPPEEGGIKIIKCTIGSDEITFQGLGAQTLATRGEGMDAVYLQSEIWTIWNNKDDSNCPSVIVHSKGVNTSQFCISPKGMVYVRFSRIKVGDCKSCNSGGYCDALQLP